MPKRDVVIYLLSGPLLTVVRGQLNSAIISAQRRSMGRVLFVLGFVFVAG